MSDTPEWIGRKPLPKEAAQKPDSIVAEAAKLLNAEGFTASGDLLSAVLVAQALDRHAKALIEASAIARSGHGS